MAKAVTQDRYCCLSRLKVVFALTGVGVEAPLRGAGTSRFSSPGGTSEMLMEMPARDAGVRWVKRPCCEEAEA